jgi:hypothetical protein
MKATRREFLETSAKMIASGVVGVSVLGKTALAAKAEPVQTQKDPTSKPSPVELRTLGRTGLKVSVISVGTIGTSENVVRYALDQGINFIHTSMNYGKAIYEVAKGIKGWKNDLYMGLKVTWDWNSDDDLNKCLKILGRDYVDVIFFNIHNDPGRVASPEAKETFERWKKQGKVKYMGLTTHSGMKACMESALKTDWYDVLMPSYTPSMRDDYLDIFEKAEKQKVGIVAMKTKISEDDPQAIPVLLKDQAVTTICKSLRTLSSVRTYIEESKKKVSATEADRVLRLATTMGLGRCVMCGACTGACPNGLAVNDIVRSVDYYLDAMNDFEAGKMNYGFIAEAQSAFQCGDCGACEKVCPNRVPIRSFIRRSKEIFV